jgi:AraC-like DNA-binding protein
MIIYVAILTIILSLMVLLNNWRLNRTSVFLSLILLAISIFAFTQHFVSAAKSPFWVAILFNNFAPLWYLTGPLLFWYTRAVIRDEIKFSVFDLIHLIPFLIHLTGIIPHLFSSFEHKLAIANELISNPSHLGTLNVNWIVSVKVNLIARPLSLILYSGYSLFLFIRHINARRRKVNAVPTGQDNNFRRWYFAFSIIMLFLGVNYLISGIQFISANIQQSGFYNLAFSTFNTYLISLLPVLLVVFPDIIYGLPRRKSNSTSNYSENKPIEQKDGPAETELLKKPETNQYFEELSEKVMKCFEEDKMFLDPEFSVDKLAEKLDVPKHHIYYLLNSLIGQKFTILKNNYRVRHAQKLLGNLDLSKFTIDSVGEQSGFSSRSSFYSCFREVTGQSPTDFLQTQGKAQSG